MTPASAMASKARTVATRLRAERALRTAAASPAVRGDGVEGRELVPGERVGAAGDDALAPDRDRALARRPVEVGEAAAVGAVVLRRVDRDAVARELGSQRAGDAVVAERGEEGGMARELAQLHGRHGAATTGLSEPLTGVGDLAGAGEAVDDAELDVLDVADDAYARRHGACGRTSAAPFWRSQRRGSR
jgi:hypothetical protein